MSERLRGTARALLAYVGVTIALLSWGAFITDPVHYRVPLLVIGLLIVAAGVAARAARLPGPVVALVQLAVALMALSSFLCHAPLPLTGGSRDLLAQVFSDCRDVIVERRPPVPVQHGIAPIVLPGGALAYWLADILAATWRRASLAGIVLLATLSVPLSVTQSTGGWLVFALTGLAFLAMLAAQQNDRVLHWGRRVEVGPNGGPQTGAAAIALCVTALAVVVPIGLPLMHLDLTGLGSGGNSKGPITVTNPMVSMYGDLKNQPTTPLLEVRLQGPASHPPQYLRLAVLTQFNGEEWSTGDRHIPSDQTADQSIKSPYDDLGTTATYSITATQNFRSNWLPAFDFTTDIDAPGDWRFDTDTYDFIAADQNLNTAGLTWTDTAADIEPSKKALSRAGFDSAGVDPRYTQLPSDFPDLVTATALQVTENQPTPFLQAVALQRWFVKDGGFRYSLQRPAGDGNQDLLHFVTDEKVGYCQQFATAMAAMARSIGIPARVAVGFLHASVGSDGSYVFRGADMHAWPELWFQGVGWVRFDPTPGVGATTPSYTHVPLVKADGQQTPSVTPPQSRRLREGDTPGPHATKKNTPAPEHTAPRASLDAGRSWTWLWVVIAFGGVGLLAAVPGWIRRRRRRRRLSGGIEDVWDELQDTARDLGVMWADGLSPRGQAARLTYHISGRAGRDALGRLVEVLERTRYARPDGITIPVSDDGWHVVAGLLDAVEPGARRRAALVPRSLLTRRPVRPARRPEQQLVDRTG